MNTKHTTIIIATAAALAAGCAKPPTTEIDAARAALENARGTQAEEYASEAWIEAQEALETLDTEIELQESKFALTRKYEHASELATQASTKAHAAATAATEEMESIRNETDELIAATRTELVAVRELLAAAPRGKGTEADLAMLNADLLEAENSIVEVEASLEAGRLYQARSTAQAALGTIESVKTEITTAQGLRKTPSQRG